MTVDDAVEAGMFHPKIRRAQMLALPVIPQGPVQMFAASGRVMDGMQFWSFVTLNGQSFRGATNTDGIWKFWTTNADQLLKFPANEIRVDF